MGLYTKLQEGVSRVEAEQAEGARLASIFQTYCSLSELALNLVPTRDEINDLVLNDSTVGLARFGDYLLNTFSFKSHLVQDELPPMDAHVTVTEIWKPKFRIDTSARYFEAKDFTPSHRARSIATVFKYVEGSEILTGLCSLAPESLFDDSLTESQKGKLVKGDLELVRESLEAIKSGKVSMEPKAS